MSNRLAGRVIAITGGGSGIGAGFAVALAREGASIGVLDVDADSANEVVRTIEGEGGRAVAHYTDVRRRDSIAAALAALNQAFGRLDVMFNNAGVTTSAEFMDVTEDDMRRLHDVNVMGVFLGTQEAARIFIAQGEGGKVINTCSISSRSASANFSAYAATKFAVLSLVQSSARSLAQYRITVNGFAPGVVDTAIWDGPSGGSAQRRAELLDSYAARIPIGRVSVPNDLAPTAIYLASGDSDYMTGQVVMIDGGMVMV